MKKKILGLVAGIVVLVSGGVLGSVFGNKLSGDGVPVDAGDDGTNYKVTATVISTGDGAVSFKLEDIVAATFGVSGSTADTVTVTVPASVAKSLHERHTSGKLEGVRLGEVSGSGDIKGEVKIIVSTPFGELTVLDKPFEYGTPVTN
jgi:hypothetical protein